MEPRLGQRVVRGPDWKWGNQDSGEGHIGTVVEVGNSMSSIPEKTVVVQWDGGRRTDYRAGFADAYDLRVLDSAPTGVEHQGVVCDGCDTGPICGTRWKCCQCNDFDLCTQCYMSDKHNIEHGFWQICQKDGPLIDTTPRSTATKVTSRGMCPGAMVVRGFDWDWGDQDGGSGNSGRVLDMRGCETESNRSAVSVLWSNGTTNVYRVGHRGKVDLRSVGDAVGGNYYREHLPVLGKPFSPSSLSTAILSDFKVGHRVKVDLEVELLKIMQDGHGGWNPMMQEVIGIIGTVVRVTQRGDVNVKYAGHDNVWNFNPCALTMVQEKLKVGDHVWVLNDQAEVIRLQREHGEWNDDMAFILGMEGKVVQIDVDGDLQVEVNGSTWTFNPECVIKTHSAVSDVVAPRRQEPTDSPPGLSPDEKEIYERAMSDGHVDIERMNIKVMGRDRVGKTCFADSLADQPFLSGQMSTDTVTVRTMIASTKPNVWSEVKESDTALYLDKPLAKGILLHQQALDQKLLDSETSASASQPSEDTDLGRLLRNSIVGETGEYSSTSTVAQPGETPPRSEISEWQFLFDDIATASQPDEAVVYSLVEKLRSDPELMQQETSLRVVKVWDFPGQPLFWSMLSGLLHFDPSPYNVTVCMLLFKMNRLLSDSAQKPVFLDYQHGPLAQPLHWIEREGDFIRYLLTAIHISQADPSADSHIGEIEGVLSPAVFVVATHADDLGAPENEKKQNEVLTQLLEKSGYDAHVILPSKDSDVKFFKVDNTKSGSPTGDETVREICSRVENMSHAFFKKRGKQLIPLRFMRLEKLIYKVVSMLGRGLIKVKMLKELAERLCHIRDEEFVVALKSLTSFAVLFYFPDVVQLNELVVISPHWLFNVMAVFASIEKPDPYLRPDWRRLKEEGIMTWRLAEYLLKSRGVKNDEYGGVLQLFRLIGIMCPRLENPNDMMSPIAAGTELFVPSLMEEQTAMSSENVGVVDNPSRLLPPSLVFYPKNVDMFPEVLFFRFIAFLLSKFPTGPKLKRYQALFELDHDLQLKVVYHACSYVTATLSSVDETIEQSSVAPYCFWLFQVMSEELHKAKHPGMVGFELDLCIHLSTDSCDSTSRIDTTKLVRVNDYTLSAPLICRDGSRVSTKKCPTLSMWFTPCFSQMFKLHDAEAIIDAVLKHGASRWYAIGLKLGYSDDEVKTMTCHTSDFADKLLAIVQAKSKSVGERKLLEDLLLACKNISNPIIGAVGHELRAV